MAHIKSKTTSPTKFIPFYVICDDCGVNWTYINLVGSKIDYRPYVHSCFTCKSESIIWTKLDLTSHPN